MFDKYGDIVEHNYQLVPQYMKLEVFTPVFVRRDKDSREFIYVDDMNEYNEYMNINYEELDTSELVKLRKLVKNIVNENYYKGNK